MIVKGLPLSIISRQRTMKNTKTIKVSFIAKGINVEKVIRFIYPYQKESKIEIFRNNMLAKYNLLFKKEPHLIKIEY